MNSKSTFRKKTGSVPLFRAILYSSTEMVVLLISNGAIPGEDEKVWSERLYRTDVSELLEAVNAQ